MYESFETLRAREHSRSPGRPIIKRFYYLRRRVIIQETKKISVNTSPTLTNQFIQLPSLRKIKDYTMDINLVEITKIVQTSFR